MDFLANKFLRRLVYFLVGFLGVALFSFAFNQPSSQRAAAAAFSSVQPSAHQAQISLWRNPSHQELNFYQ
ncbi:MAG: hypothetical protein KME15_18030 [Drouetiella hepatica Uher 2000/2452]|jgi:hypothetical protein|uniref:Uncharacterized protein n=1 Tax=Drouetiella hepatica Uher 2000/2452 TaxID=904376 RepID=A0A951UP97_9CYAN|nr:hypothetical protein [Drouetiella hepatica Uher 2000/2452]